MAALNEFGLIQAFFNPSTPEGYVGVGDDCAVFPVRPGFQVAVSTDTLIEGQHFFKDTNPTALGHKALAVSLSDLAAMGARPSGCLLALAIPTIDEDWLAHFSAGFSELAQQAKCPLIGGDTTRNPQGINITVTVFGEVPIVHALRRDRAQLNDDVWLTGTLGAPSLALSYLSSQLPMDHKRLEQSRLLLERPQPPLSFAPKLLEHAHAAIDISDGLLQDLSHILSASYCGATLQWSRLPIHSSLNGLDATLMQSLVLTGGDVYQLCFTAPPSARSALLTLASQDGVHLSRVGSITEASELVVLKENNEPMSLPAQRGFDHFV